MQNAWTAWCQEDQTDVSEQKLSRCLESSRETRHKWLSVRHSMECQTLQLNWHVVGQCLGWPAFFACVVLSLMIVAQSPEWWCRWRPRLNASSVLLIATNLQHLFVTDCVTIIHLSSPVLFLLSLQLAIHSMWPKTHSSTPGIWPLCQRGWCMNAPG